MKITVLMENTACRENLHTEHGLSLYIETGQHKILFDAGQSSAFADNAQTLGIDLAAVDFAVLSHGHYDHGGGLARFLERNAAALVYASPHAFGSHYNGAEKYIGLEKGLKDSGRFVFVREKRSIAPGITLYPADCLEERFPVHPFGLSRKEQGVLVPEDFRHEQYLLVEEEGKRILFSGCSHKGILNIAGFFRPDVLVGGFHFMKLDPESAELKEAANRLLELPIRYYTCHCTGQVQFDNMKKIMGRRLNALRTGSVLEL